MTPFNTCVFPTGGLGVVDRDLGPCFLDSLIKSLNDGALMLDFGIDTGDSCLDVDPPVTVSEREGDCFGTVVSVVSGSGRSPNTLLSSSKREGGRAGLGLLGLVCNLTNSAKLTFLSLVLVNCNLFVGKDLYEPYLTKGHEKK